MKTKNKAAQFEALGKLKLVNDPAKKGQLASPKVIFGDEARYALAAVHTRFDAVEWFVWDADGVDDVTGGPRVIRQASSIGQALVGLLK